MVRVRWLDFRSTFNDASSRSRTQPLIFRLHRSDHITDALVSLHSLRVPERITYKVAVLTYRALTGDVPQYLLQFVRVADVPSRESRHRLRSSTTDDLIVPAIRLTSIGSRSHFSVIFCFLLSTYPSFFVRSFYAANRHVSKRDQAIDVSVAK